MEAACTSAGWTEPGLAVTVESASFWQKTEKPAKVDSLIGSNDMRLMTLARGAALPYHDSILLFCMFLSQTSTSARQKPATALTVATTRWDLTSACATRPTSWDLTGNSATVCSVSRNNFDHTSRSLAADVYFNFTLSRCSDRNRDGDREQLREQQRRLFAPLPAFNRWTHLLL